MIAEYHYMIKRIISLLLLSFGILNGSLAHAQQSLFNVPSVESTENDKFFFQEQLDLFSDGIANTTLDYGLGQGWETGLTLSNVNLYATDQKQNDPILLMNVQKGFYIDEHWKVGIGTQTGSTLAGENSSARLATYNYVNNAFDFENWGKYYLGVYSANKEITGDKTMTNVLAGLEIPFTHDVHLMADYTGGKSDIGDSVVGVVWYASKAWQLSLGGQFSSSEPSHHHLQGAILEFTYVQQ